MDKEMKQMYDMNRSLFQNVFFLLHTTVMQKP